VKNTHQPISQASLLELIGLPYSAFDCWEITKLFYRKIMMLDLDAIVYDDPSDKKNVSRLIEIEKQKFKQVNSPGFGDIIVFRINGISSHIGIYINGGSFLHTMEKTGCVIDKLAKWEKRIEGYFRHDQI